ncbi:hypothetical protein WS70_20395 [Burkholderia mayonis]|uniref:Uncharacterized protein n=1 Tax=Burkholderia mayonis TaxID=1385591 RepID=A0A1B4FKM4_9BURK|nr:hypothetical protein WS70_20395 [Burkholderia mayonis]KVE43711.1 hypothetical protein WS70_08665 [Burkholderia mayonis]
MCRPPRDGAPPPTLAVALAARRLRRRAAFGADRRTHVPAACGLRIAANSKPERVNRETNLEPSGTHMQAAIEPRDAADDLRKLASIP